MATHRRNVPGSKDHWKISKAGDKKKVTVKHKCETAICLGCVICSIAALGIAVIAISALVYALEDSCDGVTCNTGGPCVVEACQAGKCVVLQEIVGCCTIDSQCTDLNPCTEDLCVDNQCVSEKANGTECAFDCDCGLYQVCASNCSCVDIPPPVGDCVRNSECEDNVTCTIDMCQTDFTCDFISIPGCCKNDTQCEDSNVCHTNFTCDQDSGLCSFAILDSDGDEVLCDIDCDDNDNSTGVASVWYRDQDGDGDGALGMELIACDQPEGWSFTFTDCDDLNPYIFYGSTQCNNTLLGTQFRITPDNEKPGQLEQFGHALTLQYDTLAVGAPGDVVDGENRGSVRVYRRESELGFGDQVFIQEAYLFEPNLTSANDAFGNDVSLSFDILAVAAPGKVHNSSVGSVFVYERTSPGNWTFRTELVEPFANISGGFGTAVAVFNTTIVISEVIGAVSIDQVYVFERYNLTTWNFTQLLTASDGAPGDVYGISIAIDQYDGDPIVIGANRESTLRGAIYVYALVGSIWTEEAKLVASDSGVSDFLGETVDVDKDVIVGGAKGYDDDPFGISEIGAAYVFRKNDTDAWVQAQIIIASDRQANDVCGTSVSIKNLTILVGCPFDDTIETNTGSINIYKQDQADIYQWVGKFIPLDSSIDPIQVGETPKSVGFWEGTVAGGAQSVATFNNSDGAAYVVACVPIVVC